MAHRVRRDVAQHGLIGLGGTALLLLALTVVAGAWWVNRYVYARHLTPTRLAAGEQATLDRKLARLDASAAGAPSAPAGDRLEPVPYRETDADREIALSERELNALVARNEAVARRVAVDLADDLVSVTLLVPFASEFPLIGGTTLRLATGLHLAYAQGRPVVAVRGVSLGGIPLPRAWWGDIKDVDLVAHFSSPGGFWDRFARGIDELRVRDGALWIRLKE